MVKVVHSRKRFEKGLKSVYILLFPDQMNNKGKIFPKTFFVNPKDGARNFRGTPLDNCLFQNSFIRVK